MNKLLSNDPNFTEWDDDVAALTYMSMSLPNLFHVSFMIGFVFPYRSTKMAKDRVTSLLVNFSRPFQARGVKSIDWIYDEGPNTVALHAHQKDIMNNVRSRLAQMRGVASSCSTASIQKI